MPGYYEKTTKWVKNYKEIRNDSRFLLYHSVKFSRSQCSTPNPAVIFFPAGTALIPMQLTLKSGVVLRGEGYQSTHPERFECDGHINVSGALTDVFSTPKAVLSKVLTRLSLLVSRARSLSGEPMLVCSKPNNNSSF